MSKDILTISEDFKKSEMLDSETSKGQLFIMNQLAIQDKLTRKGYTIVNSQKTGNFDIYICRPVEGILTCVGIAEIKSRRFAGNQKLTVDYIKDHGYLISKHKIDRGLECSKALGVPYYVIVNLMDEEVTLVWEIDSLDMETKKSWTKMTCNGGMIDRVNCYLPFSKSKKLELD